MASEAKRWIVLVSLDGGANWARYGGKEGLVEATSQHTAREQVRKTSPELHASEDAQFYVRAEAQFKPQVKRKQLIEAWRWSPVEDDSEADTQQQELPA